MRILVVEDEHDLRLLVANALRDEGYAVDAAGDGAEAVHKAEMFDYNAVVLDLMMPKMNGWQFLDWLRKTKATPVLILTARDTVDDRVRGLDGGADDYLVKPFEIKELLARLRALIRRSATEASAVIDLGSVLID